MGNMTSGLQRFLRASRTSSQADEISWRGLIERSHDGVLVVGTEGRVCYANPAAAALLGWSVEQLIGSMFGYPLCEGAPTQVEIARANALALTVEMRMARTIWNDTTAWFVSLQDITERSRV